MELDSCKCVTALRADGRPARDARFSAMLALARTRRHLARMTTSFTFDRVPYDDVSREAALSRLDVLSRLLDVAFVLPGTNVRFGVEAVLRLVPGFGDVAASALSCYLL